MNTISILLLFTILQTLSFNTLAAAPRVSLDPIFFNTRAHDFKKALNNSKVPVSQWVQDLEQKPPQLICLGETHNDKFRSFFAENFFNQYTVDTLFLEARQEQVDEFIKRLNQGETYINLLGANIAPILKIARNRNPKVRFIGVELTKMQKGAITLERVNEGTHFLSREGFIAQNVMNHFIENQRHVMLYGALHCANSDLGLGKVIPAYKLLQRVLPKDSALNVKTMFHNISNFFTASLVRFDLPKEMMVIHDAPEINPESYSLEWKMKRILKNYQDIIYVQ